MGILDGHHSYWENLREGIKKKKVSESKWEIQRASEQL